MTDNTDILIALWELIRQNPVIAGSCFAACVGLFFLEILFKRKPKVRSKDNSVCYRCKDDASGILFGWQKKKLICSPVDAEGHVIVFGGTGTGKTSALLIPTLRKWISNDVHRATFFAIDISGDIRERVDAPGSVIFDPTEQNSVPYDVFGSIDRLETGEAKIEALSQLAFLLMPTLPDADDNGRFFNDNGRKILQAALIAFYEQGLDFVDICEKIVSSSYPALFDTIDQCGSPEAIKLINGFEGASEKNTSGCKQAVDDKIMLFATNHAVMRSVHRPEEDQDAITPFSLEEKSVFVVIPDDRLKLYAPLVSLMTAQCLEYLSARPNHPKTRILLALDEFSSLGHLEMLDALRKFRKKGVRILALTQALADLDLIYGSTERRAMMNNFSFKVILSAGDTDTQEYLARLIGNEKVEKMSHTESRLSSSTTTSEQREWIIEPAELSRLDDELILITSKGFLRLKKNYYFKYDRS